MAAALVIPLTKSRKLHYRTEFQGLLISIENRRGSIRRGKNWATKMFHPYGYIRGTMGVDGDHVDCYIGPNKDAENAYIVHQQNPDTKEFDEDKVMLGFDSLESARDAYLAHYDSQDFLGDITEMPMAEFKRKVMKTRQKPKMLKSLADGRVSRKDAEQAVSALKFDMDNADFTIADLRRGMLVEIEHAKGHAPASIAIAKTLADVAKIAIAHLLESPDYYGALDKMESTLVKKSLGPMLVLPLQKSNAKWFLEPRGKDGRWIGFAAGRTGEKKTPYDTPEIIAVREATKEHGSTHLINNPKRDKLRITVAEELYNRASPKQGHQVFIVLGPSASGKSGIARKLAKSHQAIIIDSDDAKELLPEFDAGKGAGRVHQESSDISAQVQRRAVVNGDNIVRPLVGKNADKIRAHVELYTRMGYDVHVVLVDLPIDKAAQRAVDRFHENGRFVDPAYVLGLGDSPGRAYEAVKAERGITSYAKYSTDVPKGHAARLVEQGENDPSDYRRSLRLRGGQQRSISGASLAGDKVAGQAQEIDLSAKSEHLADK